MARYPNGQIPASELVRLGTEHYATPATARRLANLISDVQKSEGISLYITGGPNIYRNLAWQLVYWDALPYPQAAYPGTSSHGGEHGGRDAMAVDIANWAELGKDKFYSYARKHGFTPDVFDWEPWHIVDYNPWVMPETPGGGSSVSPGIQEGTDMTEAIISAPNGVVVHLRPGGRTNFASVDQYNTFRDQVAFLRSKGATDIMPLPPLANVPKISWDTHSFLCGYIGAPLS